MHCALELIERQAELVTLPAVYARAKAVMDDENSTSHDLVLAISSDPAMTARLLRLVNSPIWGFSGRIESVARAAVLLGMYHVHDLVLASAVTEVFQGVVPESMSVSRFWQGSMMRALAATSLARSARITDEGRVFSQGLLSDLGHMVLYLTVPAEALEAMRRAGSETWRLAEIERMLIGCDYAEVGGALMRHWSLPQCFAEATRHQLQPVATSDYALEASLVHIAGSCVDARMANVAPAVALEHVSAFAWQTTGLAPGCIDAVLKDAGEGAAATLAAFGLPRAP